MRPLVAAAFVWARPFLLEEAMQQLGIPADRWDLPPTHVFERLIAAFVSVPTHPEGSIPAGFEFMADHLRVASFEPRMLPTEPNILEVEVGDRGPLIIWIAHVDTVAPTHTTHLVPEVRDGKLFGLGAIDTKGAMVAAMLALPSIEEVARKVGFRFRMVITGDEENTQVVHTATEYARYQPEKPAIVLAGEPSRGAVSIASKGRISVQIEVGGRSAHAARPHLGIDANAWGRRIASLLEGLPFLAYRHPAFGGEGPTIVNSYIQGGDLAMLNAVSQQCIMCFDVRLLPGQSGVFEQFADLCERNSVDGLRVSVRQLSDLRPVQADPRHPYVAALGQVVQEGLPPGTNPWTTQSGGSDLSCLTWEDVPMAEFGPLGGGHHGPDEFIDLEGARTYAGQLVEWGSRLEGVVPR